MNKFKILLLGFGAIFGSALCNVSAAPPKETTVRIFALDNTCYSDCFVADQIGIEAFNVAAIAEREEISYVVRESAAIARTTKHQAKVSARGRTCRSVSVAADYRSKPLTDYGQRW